MDLIIQTRFFKHIAKMFDRASSTEPQSNLLIYKPLCPQNAPQEQPFPRKTPEEVGVSSKYIADFLSELTAVKGIDLHGVMVIKDGALICNAEFGAYKSCFWHSEHSLGKSVTAMAVGMLIDEGKLSLDDKAVKLLEKKLSPLAQITHKAITVRHLLTMTSGISFCETGAVVEENWLKAFFESYIKTEPGKVFNYNSMNTFILSCIVREVSGQTLCEYLNKKLFEPLGITVLHWEKAPDGNEIGGWGLYMRREDVAKLGKLYLDGGVWNGKRIISEKFIKDATAAHAKAPSDAGDFNYGYQTWVGRVTDSFLFNGMFGQDMIAFPKTKTIIVMNGGVEQIFQQSDYYNVLQRFFGGVFASKTPLKRSKRDERALSEILKEISREGKPQLSLFSREKIPKFITEAVNTLYSVKKPEKKEIVKLAAINGTENLGILPLMEQVLRNRYTKGIEYFKFAIKNGSLSLEVKEGNEIYSLPIKLGATVSGIISIMETEYHIAVSSEASFDEDGRGVLKLRLSFPEISSSRFIRIYFESDGLFIKMSEMPGMGLASLAATTVSESIKDKKAVADIVSRLDPDMLYYKMKNTIEPEFRLYRVG